MLCSVHILVAKSQQYLPIVLVIIDLSTPPSRIKVFPLFRRIGLPDVSGTHVTCFVIPHAGPLPKEVTVPLPDTVILLVSTLSSGGEIATVAATFKVTDGESPNAQLT
jgi:hypothetical protein